jgi:uncharacterized protein
VIDYSEKNGSLTFMVQVVPRASRSEIVGEHNGALRVRIAALPLEGAANEELVRILAREFRVTRKAIAITAGETSKRKRVSVNGVTAQALQELSQPCA